MYSVILQKTEDKVIGLKVVGEVLGLGIGITWNCFHEYGIVPEIQISLRIHNKISRLY